MRVIAVYWILHPKSTKYGRLMWEFAGKYDELGALLIRVFFSTVPLCAWICGSSFPVYARVPQPAVYRNAHRAGELITVPQSDAGIMDSVYTGGLYVPKAKKTIGKSWTWHSANWHLGSTKDLDFAVKLTLWKWHPLGVTVSYYDHEPMEQWTYTEWNCNHASHFLSSMLTTTQQAMTPLYGNTCKT